MNEQIGCPNCTNGTVTESWMTGDGQPGVPVEIHSKTNECEMCEGVGKIPDSRIP